MRRIADVSEGVLIYGDTLREPALRHEVPLAIGDAAHKRRINFQAARHPGIDPVMQPVPFQQRQRAVAI